MNLPFPSSEPKRGDRWEYLNQTAGSVCSVYHGSDLRATYLRFCKPNPDKTECPGKRCLSGRCFFQEVPDRFGRNVITEESSKI